MVAAVARPTTTYATIVADPPWPGDWFVHGRRARRRFQGAAYRLMALEEIEALPVASIAHEDANLFLWVPARLNREGVGVRVARAWGFEPCSEIVWDKPNPGMGRFPRMSHEILLVCSRGAFNLPVVTNVRSVQRWNQRYGENNGGKRHSAKPDGALDLIEQHSPGPYVELFARRHRLGWDVWGNESANTAVMPDDSIVAATPLDDAEAILLAFAGVLLGGDGRGAGLLSRRVDGRFHTARCQIGMWVVAGDSLRGGQPCSDRCESAREALNAAERWLKAREAGR